MRVGNDTPRACHSNSLPSDQLLSQVDKAYLCGFSPYDVLKDTKSDLGPNPCPIQDTKIREEWNALSQEEKVTKARC